MTNKSTGVFMLMIKKNSFLLLAVLFLLSAAVRIPFLNRPLSAHHEWLTACSLQNIQIFEETGPAKVHFSPAMTWHTPGDRAMYDTFVMNDGKGNLYYLSFPPFAFILPWAVFHILHIPVSVLAIQLFNIILHGISAMLLFLLVRRLLGGRCARNDAAGLAAAAVYLFSPAPLWFQGNIYMSDMAVQVFFAATLYLFIRALDDGRKSWWVYPLLALVSFMAVYTEWLGVFVAAGAGLVFLFRQRNSRTLWATVMVGVGAIAALALTFWQYSGINGMEAYLAYAREKFIFRTGMPGKASFGLSFTNFNSWGNIIVNYLGAFGPVLVLMVVLGIRLNKKQPEKMGRSHYFDAYLLALLPVIFHHLVFFNFTSIHDFSALKSGYWIALLAAWQVYRLWPEGDSDFQWLGKGALSLWWRPVLLTFGFSLLFFYLINSFGAHSHFKTVGEQIRSEAKTDEIILLDGPGLDIWPQLIWYAHRNFGFWRGEDNARDRARNNGLNKAIKFTVEMEKGKVLNIERFEFTNR